MKDIEKVTFAAKQFKKEGYTTETIKNGDDYSLAIRAINDSFDDGQFIAISEAVIEEKANLWIRENTNGFKRRI